MLVKSKTVQWMARILFYMVVTPLLFNIIKEKSLFVMFAIGGMEYLGHIQAKKSQQRYESQYMPLVEASELELWANISPHPRGCVISAGKENAETKQLGEILEKHLQEVEIPYFLFHRYTFENSKTGELITIPLLLLTAHGITCLDYLIEPKAEIRGTVKSKKWKKVYSSNRQKEIQNPYYRLETQLGGLQQLGEELEWDTIMLEQIHSELLTSSDTVFKTIDLPLLLPHKLRRWVRRQKKTNYEFEELYPLMSDLLNQWVKI